MGLFDSKSSSKSTASQSGAQSETGNPISLSLVGKGNQAHINYSDYGAINSALTFADNVAARQLQLSMREVAAVERTSTKMLDGSLALAGRNIESSERTAKSTLESSQQIAERRLNSTENTAQRMLESGEAITENVMQSGGKMLDYARDAVQGVGGMAESFQEFINAENNPNEKTQVYLIAGAAAVALAVVMRGAF